MRGPRGCCPNVSRTGGVLTPPKSGYLPDGTDALLVSTTGGFSVPLRRRAHLSCYLVPLDRSCFKNRRGVHPSEEVVVHHQAPQPLLCFKNRRDVHPSEVARMMRASSWAICFKNQRDVHPSEVGQGIILCALSASFQEPEGLSTLRRTLTPAASRSRRVTCFKNRRVFHPSEVA